MYRFHSFDTNVLFLDHNTNEQVENLAAHQGFNHGKTLVVYGVFLLVYIFSFFTLFVLIRMEDFSNLLA